MSKFVQGVQGIVQGAVQGATPYCAWPVQGVQRCSLRDARARAKNQPKNLKTNFLYICTLHTLHTLHTPTYIYICYFCMPAHSPAHPAQLIIFSTSTKNKEKLMTVYKAGPDNLKQMQTLLRKELPEVNALVKDLYAAGMIPGLRSLIIETDHQFNTKRTLTEQPSKTCSECQFWQRDTIGFGEGVGTCTASIDRLVLPWPKQLACCHYQPQ